MATGPRLSTFEDFEDELVRWIERLKLVDVLLERPALTLIDLVDRASKEARVEDRLAKGYAYDPDKFFIPTTIGQKNGRPGPYLLRAACCSTVQRLIQRKRRFPWLAKQPLTEMGAELYGPFIAIDKKSRRRDADGNAAPCDPASLYAAFAREPLEPMSPLTAAEIFWVLIKAGEKYAHGALGFFCLFNMLWTLGAHGDEDLAERAADPRDRPTPFIVAKCLQPIRVLCDILRHRAELYREIERLVKTIEAHSGGRSQRDLWLFVSGLERLASALADFATVATNPADYTAYSNRITAIADSFTTESPKNLQQSWRTVRGFICKLLGMSYELNSRILKSAVEFAKGLEPVYKAKNDAEASAALKRLMPHDEFERADDEIHHRIKAFRSAYRCCTRALRLLRAGIRISRKYYLSTAIVNVKKLSESLRLLATVNDRVAERIELSVDHNTHLLRRVITREVASASAGDQTNFDPADLVASLGTVERWLRISDLEVDDALKWSVAGAHPDGSWSSRHPIPMDTATATMWPGTSEIVWMLTMAVERKSRLRAGDDALYAYVQWLDRTKIDFRRHGDPHWISGWPCEARAPEVIDVAATMSAVNALLSIRDLIEERLWEICEKRFTVKQQTKSLLDVDPVDLGARHLRRLHRRLMHMARETNGPDYASAEYSLVLHGPPGSSKTAIGEALAGEMWGRHRGRLIRVTPADFTRQGEARLDSEARFIFDLLSHIRGATIVFDEIDDLLKRRHPDDRSMSFLRLVVPAMLNRLQDLRDSAPKQEICFLFSTNYIDSIEPALTRPGRFDATVAVAYPDAWSRENILQRNIDEAARQYPERSVVIDRAQQPELIAETNAWPFSTFNKMCRELTTKPAGTAKDIVVQIERHKEAVDDSVAYYLRPERWSDVSRPLEHELLHAMFALPDLETAKRKLGDVTSKLIESGAKWLEKTEGKSPQDRLEEMWKRDARPAKWDYNPSVPRRSVTGSATKMRMGATVDRHGTTFRVWAPFAMQMAVRGDAFEDWHQPIDMQPLRDLPGVWEATVDSLTLEKLQQREANGVAPPQYRYVVSGNEEIKDPYRSDPYGREWAVATYQDTQVINSVVVAPSSTVARGASADREGLIVCRLCVACLPGDRPWETARQTLPLIQSLGFTAIEIGPICDKQCDERRWGYDRVHPYGIASSGGGVAAILRFVREARDVGLEVIMRSAWGFFGEGGPLLHFDGWCSPLYPRGIYFNRDAADTCLDLDEPYVCNLIFDHAVECVEQYGVAGVHVIFAPLILEKEKPQAASLAHDLARRLGDLNSHVLIDSLASVGELHRSETARPILCYDAAERIANNAIPVSSLDRDGFRSVVSTGALDDRRAGALAAIFAFTLPVIPSVQWHDRLNNPDDGLTLLLRELIAHRRSNAQLVKAMGKEINLDTKKIAAYHGSSGDDEMMVFINHGDETIYRPVDGDGDWRVEFDSAWKSYGGDVDEQRLLRATESGSHPRLPIDIDAVSARVISRRRTPPK